MSPALVDIQNRNLKPYLTEFLALIKESKTILGDYKLSRDTHRIIPRLEECAKKVEYPEDELLDDLAIALVECIDEGEERNYTAAYVARYIILDWVEKSAVREIDAHVCHGIFEIDGDDEERVANLASKVNLQFIQD